MKTKNIVCLIAAGALTVGVVGMALVMKSKINSLSHQNIAKDFGKDEKFSQITLFVPKTSEFTLDKIMYFRYELEKKLTEKSMEPKNEGARLYADAFCGYEDMIVAPADSFGGSKSVQSKVMYVGGDYRLFYPELWSVPQVTENVNHDRILLSKTVAWQLFGGYSLNDFELSVNSKPYFVSGVFEDYTEEEYSEFLGNAPLCIADLEYAPKTSVTVYRIVLCDPVKDFAKNAVKESLSLTEGTYYMVENSKRFSLGSLYQKIPELLKSDKQLPQGVVITPDEMMALRVEKQLALMLGILTLLAVFPCVVALVLVFKAGAWLKGKFDKYVTNKIRDKLSYS